MASLPTDKLKAAERASLSSAAILPESELSFDLRPSAERTDGSKEAKFWPAVESLAAVSIRVLYRFILAKLLAGSKDEADEEEDGDEPSCTDTFVEQDDEQHVTEEHSIYKINTFDK